MKTLSLNKAGIATVLAATCFISTQAFATGNGAPAGPHYNLNIIGVDSAKKAKLINSDRHTIFVALGSSKTSTTVNTKIWLTPGPDFQVCDGNGFDAAYGCDQTFDSQWNYYDASGEQVTASKQGAVFQLPCNSNLDGEYYTDPLTGEQVALDRFISCNQVVTETGEIIDLEPGDSRIVPAAEYQVWARALGAPKGSATVTTCATVQGELVCSMENTVMTRTTGKSMFTDVTNQLTSLVAEYCFGIYDPVANTCDDPTDVTSNNDGDWYTTRIALFAGDTEDWFWNYDNKGLRLAQLRFYYLDDIKN
jgi:hypothetical protein